MDWAGTWQVSNVMLPMIAGVALLVVTVATARRPGEPLPDRDGYFERWRDLHGGYDARTGNVFLRGWLSMAYVIARPLAAAGIWPTVLTVWTVWLAAVVFTAAAKGGRWPLLAGGLLVLSGLGDTLDGGVAALTDRATAWGYVLDSAVDRVNDLIYLAALVSLGAPPGLAVLCAIAFFLLEYLRARSANAGGSEVGVVTVGERANRVIFCALGLLLGGIVVAQAAAIATTSLGVLTVLSLVGLAQLLLAIRRDLAGRPPPAHRSRGGAPDR